MNLSNENQEQPDQQQTDNGELTKLSLIEERLSVGVRQVETGRVSLHKRVVSEEVSQEVALTREEVQVERIAVNRYVDTAPAVRYEGDRTIIPVVKEVLVVEKRLVLVEELHISKKQVTFAETVREVLRKEEIGVGRTGAPQADTTPNQQ